LASSLCHEPLAQSSFIPLPAASFFLPIRRPLPAYQFPLPSP
jgi:hypothetical protein